MKTFFQKNSKIILTTLIVLMLLFIWSNSLAVSQQSNAISGRIERWLKPLIDPQGRISDKLFDYMVRKAAHFIEYAIFGTLLALVNKSMKVRHVWPQLFFAMISAVIDETIQIFTGRTSQVQDIWIDFGGALIGMIFIQLMFKLSQKHNSF